MANCLADERSPYLLQHKDNPVDWYPWGDEAFERAKKESKPIFLSIGYATCHWCHVMEKESFEDEDIASYLNQHFISIKVDREERPDIDHTYMPVCQMLTGQGGWPLTIVMTPEKEAFYAATYIPKQARFGRLGLPQILRGIKGMWAHEPEKIRKVVEQIKKGYENYSHHESGEYPDTRALENAYAYFEKNFDGLNGGFGQAPKFPSPHNLMFLFREWKEHGNDHALEMALTTLKKMRLSGLWDHLGYGFHRYSTDKEWLLPHFEKMLYDQALMLLAYAEGWQISKNDLFKQTSYQIIEYLLSRMKSDDGGFFSAEDADSEGEEGKYYTWTFHELEELRASKQISTDEFEFLCERFQLSLEGNMINEATRQSTGRTILHLHEPLQEQELEKWTALRTKLLAIRSGRIAPLCDDKILCDWNALLLVALSTTARIFQDRNLENLCLELDAFINKHFRRDSSNSIIEHSLRHVYKAGSSTIDGFAEDYVFLLWAKLELYRLFHSAHYLQESVALANLILSQFWDSDKGGIFQSNHSDSQVFGPQKVLYDGAIPSSNSSFALSLLQLYHLTWDEKWANYAHNIGASFSHEWTLNGGSITVGMMSLQYHYYSPTQWVLVKGNDDGVDDASSLANGFKEVLGNHFLPNAIVHELTAENVKDLTSEIPYLSLYAKLREKTLLYRCSNYSCDQPMERLSELENYLDDD
jgi:uncharacterized protein YyaL (SSP411 family)